MRQRVAVVVVGDVLVEHAADALHHAAGDLALDDLGLIMTPQSSLTTYRRIVTAPVSRSTSHDAHVARVRPRDRRGGV